MQYRKIIIFVYVAYIPQIQSLYPMNKFLQITEEMAAENQKAIPIKIGSEPALIMDPGFFVQAAYRKAAAIHSEKYLKGIDAFISNDQSEAVTYQAAFVYAGFVRNPDKSPAFSLEKPEEIERFIIALMGYPDALKEIQDAIVRLSGGSTQDEETTEDEPGDSIPLA